MSNEQIDYIFGPQGYLAQAFPGYEPRPGQVAFARAVDTAIQTDGKLVAECPTGTGKSVGYLAPAIMQAVAAGRKVVVVTANIALQEQLVGKDLPMLRKILPLPFTFALMKGMGNYVCADKLRSRVYMNDAFASDPTQAQTIYNWAGKTRTGDVSELPFQPGPVWQHFSVSAGECKGSDCAMKDACFGRAARETCRQADVIVCNYHILLTHLDLRAKIGKDVLLPELDVVILDEAHKLPDLAREFFGGSLSLGALKRYGRFLNILNAHGYRARLMSEAERFFADLSVYRNSKQYKARLRKPDVVPWERLADVMNATADELSKGAKELTVEAANEYGQDIARDIAKAAMRLRDQAQFLQTAMTLAGDGRVYHLSTEGRSPSVTLKETLVEAGPALEATLGQWARCVVATSATLTVENTFEFFQKEAGIPEAARLIASTPFDYWNQCLTVIPNGLPDPKGDRAVYEKGICDAVVAAVCAARGRTLCLFTSYRMMEAAHTALLGANLPYRILRQGDMPRTALVEEFKADVSSVLLGVESFWAGVDVPGEALSCVVIDKLPFVTPDDPVIDALAEADPEGWFFSVSMPRAVVQMKQGCGRLIRASTDRGVLVLLDSRLVTKAYGRTFLRSLPKTRVARSMDAVGPFLDPPMGS